jgi:hypothetical protein
MAGGACTLGICPKARRRLVRGCTQNSRDPNGFLLSTGLCLEVPEVTSAPKCPEQVSQGRSELWWFWGRTPGHQPYKVLLFLDDAYCSGLNPVEASQPGPWPHLKKPFEAGVNRISNFLAQP